MLVGKAYGGWRMAGWWVLDLSYHWETECETFDSLEEKALV